MLKPIDDEETHLDQYRWRFYFKSSSYKSDCARAVAAVEECKKNLKKKLHSCFDEIIKEHQQTIDVKEQELQESKASWKKRVKTSQTELESCRKKLIATANKKNEVEDEYQTSIHCCNEFLPLLGHELRKELSRNLAMLNQTKNPTMKFLYLCHLYSICRSKDELELKHD